MLKLVLVWCSFFFPSSSPEIQKAKLRVVLKFKKDVNTFNLPMVRDRNRKRTVCGLDRRQGKVKVPCGVVVRVFFFVSKLGASVN